jgi:predicted Rossmann fold flavoprotein
VSPLTIELPAAVDIAIVGAGAAGLATAILARRRNPGRSVLLLEGAGRPGAKILISGGGRCNVTNTVVTDRDFWGGRHTIVRQILRAFPVAETIVFFREIGVPLHEEADGKLFPDSNRARDVLEALLREVDALRVPLFADHRVGDVASGAGGFTISTNRGAFLARAVVLATGGRSVPKTGSDGGGYAIAERLGHTIVPTTPGLAPLMLDDVAWRRGLSGVSHDVELTIWEDGSVARRLNGALLWTHFGVSGPVALNASRHWARARLEGRSVKITVNFLPGRTFDLIDERLTQLATDRPKASVLTAVSTLMPASVAGALVRRLEIAEDLALSRLSRERRRRLAHSLAEWPLPVADTRGFNFAEVTAGGVSLAEIDPSTMESRRSPGLYFVGEILDVDGRIGGFNFQWGWATAAVAARGLAARVTAN